MEQQQVSRGRGRPPKPRDEVKRASFQTRMREPLRMRLEIAAEENGRSLSEEIEQRLEDSFRGLPVLKAAFGGEFGWQLALMLFTSFRPPGVRTIQLNPEFQSLDWLEDPAKFEDALRSLIRKTWEQHPKSPSLDHFLEFLLDFGRGEIARSQSGFIRRPQTRAKGEGATPPAPKKNARQVFAEAA